MANNRGRAKQLAKKKQKRASLKQSERQRARSNSPPMLRRRAGEFPVDRCWLSPEWKSTEPGLVTAVIARRAPGWFLVGTVLIDRTCLGAKNAFCKDMDSIGLAGLVQRLASMHEGEMQEVELATLQAVVFHAIDYAQSLGFAPHSDFLPAMFGPRPDVLQETPLAHPDRPLYVPGPDDNVLGVLSRLNEKCGPNGFSVGTASGPMTMPLGGEEEEEEDADDGGDDEQEEDGSEQSGGEGVTP